MAHDPISRESSRASFDTERRHRFLRDRDRTKPRHSAAFLKLQKEWYSKLAASGFVDVEYGRDDPDNQMRQHQLFDRAAAERGAAAGNADHMAAVNELRNYATFDSLFRRIVTGLYALGLSEFGIRKGLANQRHATTGAVHRAVENARSAGTRLAATGVLVEDDNDDA